ncbi:Ribokinase-like [Sesbania bispinosa]|nr:Ribokinase-like [Sesbania bispinosa]
MTQQIPQLHGHRLQTLPHRGLVVGNYCHDVLLRDGLTVAQTLGGAASFISTVLDGLSLPFQLISKVGPDFAHATLTTNHPPLVAPTSATTLFHAHFGSGHPDRVLKRVTSCDPITPSDLPSGTRFGFGLAVGVGGEILPETLERMVEICDQSSEDEASFTDLEEVRRLCAWWSRTGKMGVSCFCKDGGLRVDPFGANQVDPYRRRGLFPRRFLPPGLCRVWLCLMLLCWGTSLVPGCGTSGTTHD